jgi:hypothetical protein
MALLELDMWRGHVIVTLCRGHFYMKVCLEVGRSLGTAESGWCLGERWIGVGGLSALLVSYIIHCSIQPVDRLFLLALCIGTVAVSLRAQVYAN